MLQEFSKAERLQAQAEADERAAQKAAAAEAKNRLRRRRSGVTSAFAKAATTELF
jgi:hypothetical protein